MLKLKQKKQRKMSLFAKNILFFGSVIITVFCVGYIASLEYMDFTYRSALEFYALLMAELVCFVCFADFIYKSS